MTKGVTSSGFAFEFEEERLDDMRVVDLIAEVDAPETPDFRRACAVSSLGTMLLGAELKAALYAHIGQAHGGRVPQAAIVTALVEIMSAAGQGAEKNS